MDTVTASRGERRCTRCIMPVDLPGVTTDAEGVCSGCLDHDRAGGPLPFGDGLQRMRDLVITHPGRGKYDCLVPLSGGKDSTYLLYVAAAELGLRVLAFNLDNGFRSEQAIGNMRRATDALGVDLAVESVPPELMSTMFRAFLTRCGEFCSACNWLIGEKAQEVAAKNGIGVMFSGNSNRLSGGIEGISHSIYCDRTYVTNVLRGELTRRQLRWVLGPSYARKTILRLAGRWPSTVNVLEYLDIDVGGMQQTIERELGWIKPGPEVEHGDCKLASLKDHLMYRKWSVSELTSFYSNLVRNGELSREEALLRAAEEEPAKAPEVLGELLETLGMSELEFERAARHDFTEVPNRRKSALFTLAKRTVDALTVGSSAKTAEAGAADRA